MSRTGQETPQSNMSLLLGTVLMLLMLPDASGNQKSCTVLRRGDRTPECCNTLVESEEQDHGTPSPDLPWHCRELGRSSSPACACLRERWLRMLPSVGPSLQGRLEGLKVLLLNISRALTRDVLISFSSTEGPRMMKVTEKSKTGKIQLPREIFQSLSSLAARLVVIVLNLQHFGMFKEVNQTGQVLDDMVVGITVGETGISGLQNPVKLSFAHGQLPHGLTPQCVFWDATKGLVGGWSSSGCTTQPGDEETVCSCDHLTFFTLLLNPALDVATAQPLLAVASAGCGVATAFAILTIAFCLFLRCGFRFEESLRVNLGLHLNLVGSLFLLNLAFLLNSRLAAGSQPGTCKVLGGFTHYCLLCCFTWMALEGCHLYLLFVKVLGTYIHHYLVKLCLIGWGFPVLVVGVAGLIGSYGEYSIQTLDHQPIAYLCWITSKHLLVHYITNCGYFGLIFLFNMAVFAVVIHKSCSLQGTGAGQQGRKAWKVALVAVGLFCLLGATWAFAFLTHGTSSGPMLYLFTILNSLQGGVKYEVPTTNMEMVVAPNHIHTSTGIFILLWLVVLYYPKTKETTGSLSNIIRHDKATTVSQD